MLELVGKRPARPVDPLSDLAKAFDGTAAKPADDDGDGDDNEPLPIEEGLDREPGKA